MSSRGALVTALAVLLAGRATAQISSSAVPVYHGKLEVRQPASGTINRQTGQVSLAVHNWLFMPSSLSNGIFPDKEPVLVAIGEDSFRIDAGGLVALRHGKLFSYRAPRSVVRGIRRLRLWPQPDGTYRVQFTLAGADLSRLNIEDPICVPMALIVGDDDGFSGVTVGSRSFHSRRISVPASCSAGSDWPWIQN